VRSSRDLSEVASTVKDMARRNPKKDKTARRRRPDMPGLSRASFTMEDVYGMMAGAPPAPLPLFALTALWLWNLAEDRAAAAHCVDGCLTLHYALAAYGIESRTEAVTICIEDQRPGARPGVMVGRDPHFNTDGTFNGHTVLVATGAGRFIDPTIQQFTPGQDWRSRLPLIAGLPQPDGLGEVPIGAVRGDYAVLYAQLPPAQRRAWRSPRLVAREADYRSAGENLAANTLDLLQMPDIRPKALQVPYPRLRTLLEALHGMPAVADRDGYRFADPATGREIWLSDVP
jgi:hypothetical protein